MTYATNRGLVWVLDNVKKRGGGGLPNSNASLAGLGSGPSSLQLPSGPPLSLNPQGINIVYLHLLILIMHDGMHDILQRIFHILYRCRTKE